MTKMAREILVGDQRWTCMDDIPEHFKPEFKAFEPEFGDLRWPVDHVMPFTWTETL